MADAVAEIRQLVDERVAAVRAKDAETLAARQASGTRSFDVTPPLESRGSEAIAEQTQAWFDGYEGEIGYEVRELEVSADSDVAFCSFVYHVTGTLKEGAEISMWVRATLGCERVDGRWLVTHDHESVPINPENREGLTELEP